MTAAPSRAPCLGDRAAGLAMVAAWGDALGARYEAIRWAPRADRVRLGRGVLVWRAPGWWTDDTDMSLGVMLACRDLLEGGHSTSALADETGRMAVLRRWLAWHSGANPLDAGLNTWRVLHRIRRVSPLDVEAAVAISHRQLNKHHRGGGNGAVMRTAPVALAFPGDPQRAWAAAAGLAELTHPQPAAVQAAGLWTVLCERALVTGELHPADAAAAMERVHGGDWTGTRWSLPDLGELARTVVTAMGGSVH